MQGYFFLRLNGPQSFPWFLLPHTLGLFLFGLLGYRINFSRVSLTAGIITTLVTAIYPFLGPLQNIFLLLLGLTSALLAIRIGCLLRSCSHPVMAAARGLALGNIFLALFLWIDPPQKILFPFLGLLLLAQIPAPFHPQQKEPLRDLLAYLPFIFIFYLLIGTFYVCLMPFYVRFSYFQGLELFFYLGAVLLAALLFHQKRDYPLAIGVGMGVFAVAFLHDFNRLTSNLAMYAVQAAAGFMDIFCLGLFLQGRDVIRRFGLGAGCMLAGPTVGLPLLYAQRWPLFMCTGGNLVLGIGLILFYFVQSTLSRKSSESISSAPDTPSPPEEQETHLAEVCRSLGAPREIFSYREWEILKLAVSGKAIREIASLLHLSESSVKTYLQRIYRKLGVSSKAELLRKLARAGGVAPEDHPSP